MGTLLGARIKEARLKRRLSGAEMARRIGMDVGQYHRLEHADNADPPFSTVVRIARELDISLDWLALTIADEPKGTAKRKSIAASRKVLLAAMERLQQLLADETPTAIEDRGKAAPRSKSRKNIHT